MPFVDSSNSWLWRSIINLSTCCCAGPALAKGLSLTSTCPTSSASFFKSSSTASYARSKPKPSSTQITEPMIFTTSPSPAASLNFTRSPILNSIIKKPRPEAGVKFITYYYVNLFHSDSLREHSFIHLE